MRRKAQASPPCSRFSQTPVNEQRWPSSTSTWELRVTEERSHPGRKEAGQGVGGNHLSSHLEIRSSHLILCVTRIPDRFESETWNLLKQGLFFWWAKDLAITEH